jgi:CubicO group peptidase (beta-lactamase class C family)
VVVKDGKIVYEKYRQWTGVNDKLYSASMAKTLTSIMIGILLDEKKLELSTKVLEILPELAKSAFAEDSVEDLLRMNSSAKLRDCYEDCSDGDNQVLNPLISPRTNTLEYLSQKIDKSEKPFFYSAANTAILGLIIERVSGKTAASFWAEKVWNAVGAESEGYWIVNNRKELGFQCCYTATARDWIKIGVMLANYGEINQSRILSKILPGV